MRTSSRPGPGSFVCGTSGIGFYSPPEKGQPGKKDVRVFVLKATNTDMDHLKQTDLFGGEASDGPRIQPVKMLILAQEILLDPIVKNDDFEARERLKIACAKARIAYDSFDIGEALRRARGRGAR